MCHLLALLEAHPILHVSGVRVNTYISLMYELKKMESYLRVNLLGPGPRIMKKRIYRAAVSQSLRNTALDPLITYTGLLKMTVGVLTTCHSQYT